MSLQVRIKIRNDMNSTLNCCKFEDRVPYGLVSGVFTNIRVVDAILPVMVTQKDT